MRHRYVGKLRSRGGPLEQHPSAGHVAVTEELLREDEPFPENRQQDVYILSSSHTPEQHDLAFGSNPVGDFAGVPLERVPVSRLLGVDWNCGEALQVLQSDQRARRV
jgi:hypothetical protein